MVMYLGQQGQTMFYKKSQIGQEDGQSKVRISTADERSVEDFKATDHYQISRIAKSAVARIREVVPATVDLNHIHYEFFPTATRTFGRAHADYNQEWANIKLHPAYRNISVQKEMYETLCHEIGHIAAYRWKGQQGWGHSYHWGYIMIALGFEPARLASDEKSRKVWAAEKLEGLPQFLYDDCPTCNAGRMFEIDDLKGIYVCPECGVQRLPIL